MSDMGVFPQGRDSQYIKFWASQGAPQAEDFIAFLDPASVPHSYEQFAPGAMSWLKIDTTETGCRITAEPWVVIENGEAIGFSCWSSTEGSYYGEGGLFSKERTVQLRKEDFGWMALIYTAPVPWLLQPRRPWGWIWLMRRLYLMWRWIVVPPRPPRPEQVIKPAEDAIMKRELAKLQPRVDPEKVTTPLEEVVLTSH